MFKIKCRIDASTLYSASRKGRKRKEREEEEKRNAAIGRKSATICGMKRMAIMREEIFTIKGRVG